MITGKGKKRRVENALMFFSQTKNGKNHPREVVERLGGKKRGGRKNLRCRRVIGETIREVWS